MEFHHVSVLREETIHAVLGDPAGIYVDCTLGGGGHSRALADLLVKDGLIIGLDQDEDAIRAATERMQDAPCRFTAVQRNFRYLGEVLDDLNIPTVDGIMFDLGVSSYQLDNPERGFSYQHDGPLDMRMDRHGKKSAYDVINAYDEADLYRIITVKNDGPSALLLLSSKLDGKNLLNELKNWFELLSRLFLPGLVKTDLIRRSGLFRLSGLK